LLRHKIRDRASASDLGFTRLPRPLGPVHEAAPLEVLEWALRLHPREAGYRFSATGDNKVGSLLDLLEMLAQSVVQISYADLNLFAM
jgi:hypothetical protein